MKSFGEVFRYQYISKYDKMRFFGVEFENRKFFQAKMYSNGNIDLYELGEDTLPARTIILSYKLHN